MSYATLSIGEAVRVHMREEEARTYYRVYRNLYLSQKRAFPGLRDTTRNLIQVISWRSRWTALAEIIEAEERRVAA